MLGLERDERRENLHERLRHRFLRVEDLVQLPLDVRVAVMEDVDARWDAVDVDVDSIGDVDTAAARRLDRSAVLSGFLFLFRDSPPYLDLSDTSGEYPRGAEEIQPTASRARVNQKIPACDVHRRCEGEP